MSFIEILPFEGAGEIRFGMTLPELRARTPDVTLKVNGQLHSAQIGAFIDFDDDGRLQGIEFTIGAGGPAPVLNGVILNGPVGKLADSLATQGLECQRGVGTSSDTIFVSRAGVTRWTEDLDDEHAQSTGV